MVIFNLKGMSIKEFIRNQCTRPQIYEKLPDLLIIEIENVEKKLF
jgi:hypothetical protein